MEWWEEKQDPSGLGRDEAEGSRIRECKLDCLNLWSESHSAFEVSASNNFLGDATVLFCNPIGHLNIFI